MLCEVPLRRVRWTTSATLPDLAHPRVLTLLFPPGELVGCSIRVYGLGKDPVEDGVVAVVGEEAHRVPLLEAYRLCPNCSSLVAIRSLNAPSKDPWKCMLLPFPGRHSEPCTPSSLHQATGIMTHTPDFRTWANPPLGSLLHDAGGNPHLHVEGKLVLLASACGHPRNGVG